MAFSKNIVRISSVSYLWALLSLATSQLAYVTQEYSGPLVSHELSMYPCDCSTETCDAFPSGNDSRAARDTNTPHFTAHLRRTDRPSRSALATPSPSYQSLELLDDLLRVRTVHTGQGNTPSQCQRVPTIFGSAGHRQAKRQPQTHQYRRSHWISRYYEHTGKSG